MPAVTVAFELTVLYIVYSVLKSLFLNSRINDFLTKHSLVFGTVELNLLYTYIVPKEGFLDVLMKKAYTKCFPMLRTHVLHVCVPVFQLPHHVVQYL